jgi:hypothetical protein
MRQHVGEKKVKKYREFTGLPVCAALVRGNTEHRIDLLLEGGKVMHWWPKSNNEMALAENLGWDYNDWLLRQSERGANDEA